MEARVRIETGSTEPAPPVSPWAYAFGPFKLDPSRGLLTYGNDVVPLPERLFAILLALIQANGRIVSRESLAAIISPDGPVSEANLAQHVYMLRRILGERARDRLYVMTAHSKGFRLAAPISVVAPSPEEVSPERPRTRNDALLSGGFDAFRHYSRACYMLERRTAPALTTAIEHFEAALAINSDYLPALIDMARAHAYLAEYWYVPGSYAFPKAKDAIVRALKLEPSSANAHAALSNIMLFCEWNWREAKREIDAAVRLNPDSISVCTNAVWFYECSGASERALTEAQHALLLEPSSPMLQILIGRVLAYCGEYESAIDYFSNLIESGPEFAPARRHRAQAYVLSGRPGEAVADLLSLPQDRSEDIALRLPLLARAYADLGETEHAADIYATLQKTAATEFVVHWNLAMVAVGLRRYGEALDHLEKAVEEREPSVPFLRDSPLFEPIAKTSRFKALLRSTGL